MAEPMTLLEFRDAVRDELGAGPTFRLELSVLSRGDADRLLELLGRGSIEWEIYVDDAPGLSDRTLVSAPTPELALYELRKALGRVPAESVEQASARVGGAVGGES